MKLYVSVAHTKSVHRYNEKLELEDSFDKGKAEDKLEIALNLSAEGLDVKLIVKATGLTEAEIKNLQT